MNLASTLCRTFLTSHEKKRLEKAVSTKIVFDWICQDCRRKALEAQYLKESGAFVVGSMVTGCTWGQAGTRCSLVGRLFRFGCLATF